ncbi:unnamed protein product [Aureobasidium uvarum]|uniref:Uncharacterized protein n=1 Tax=Aureobasidium uvarum TaxID=2773716 RepID=A0A9N8PPF6_9PEZI|nr:unnamed protein product [Aureobasidium uvarum]
MPAAAPGTSPDRAPEPASEAGSEFTDHAEASHQDEESVAVESDEEESNEEESGEEEPIEEESVERQSITEESVADFSEEELEERFPWIMDLVRGFSSSGDATSFRSPNPLGPIARPSWLQDSQPPRRSAQRIFGIPDSQRQNEPQIRRSTMLTQSFDMQAQQTELKPRRCVIQSHQTEIRTPQTENQTLQLGMLAEDGQPLENRVADHGLCDNFSRQPVHPESSSWSREDAAGRFLPPVTQEARQGCMAQYRDIEQEHESHICSMLLPCYNIACMRDMPGGRGCRYSDLFYSKRVDSRTLNSGSSKSGSTRPCVWGWGKILREYEREHGLFAAIIDDWEKVAAWYRERHVYDERFTGPVLVRDPPNAAEGTKYYWVPEPAQNWRERRSTL